MKKWILIILAIVIWQNWGKFNQTIYPPEDYGAIHSSDVILYATSWCGYCEKMRFFLKEKGIPYIEFDIEKSKEASIEFQRLGGGGIPLLLVKGSVINGYNPSAVIDALRR